MAKQEPYALIEGLNEAQAQAVQHTDGPAMIIAGAGSGKTRALTHRLAYMIATGEASAWELLALTFTNKAAREMRERIYQLIGPDARNITMGTFHSVFSRILRKEASRIGFTSEFTIYDESDSLNMVKTLLKELGKDDKKFKPKNIRHLIGSAKNQLISPETFQREYVDDEYRQVAGEIYPRYQRRLHQANAMDFDDLLYYMAYLLNNYPEQLYKYQHKWRFIMVDEYQDTNHAQYLITKKIAAVHENLCVVGDDAQSIYSFRGADIQNILNFKRDHPDYELYKLERNYRSTKTIVEAAGEVIANNEEQIPKEVFTENETGEKIRLLISLNEQEEAHKVVDTIREQRLQHSLHPKDFAILYRTNAQSRILEDSLRKAGIPYKIYGGTSFYQRKEIKDVLAYLRLAINPEDEEAFKRVVNYPARGVGAKTLQNLQARAEELGAPLWQAAQQAEQFLSGRMVKPLKDFVTLVTSFQYIASNNTAHQAVEQIARNSGILKELHNENTVESLSRWENVQELINAAQSFSEQLQQAETDEDLEQTDSLSSFLQDIALMTDQDSGEEQDPDHVSLMTVHGAKGLEFPCVLITGLEEGLFPLHMAMQDRADLEEERRLFYVAMTRAEKLLTLSYAETRLKFGERNTGEPSRFLEEIPETYMQIPRKPKGARGSEEEQAAANQGQVPPRQRIAQQNRERTGGANNRFSADKQGNATGNGKANGQGKGQSNGQGPPRPQQPQPSRMTPVDAAKNTQRKTPEKGEYQVPDPSNLAVGKRVEHPKFGVGEIVQLTEDRMVAKFPRKGDTTLMLKFAKLKILD